MNHLSLALIDIGSSALRLLDSNIGPNLWDAVKDDPSEFGNNFDFTVNHQGTVIDPVSNAALQWCYYHLPEDCPRWGRVGFAIETRYVADILAGMRRDGLMSEQEYVYNMNAEEQDRLAGDNL